MKKQNFNSGTIWTGDNLKVMRGLNSESVDLIYLDPPFNSNRNYSAPVGSEAAGAAFKDMWDLSDIDIYEHGELADSHPAAYAVIQSAAESHSKGMQAYLIFMAVRLLEMKRILKPTGSIYLHCDDTADYRLRCLMDAVFGAKNYGATITWKRTSAHSDTMFGRVTDTVLYYHLGNPLKNMSATLIPYTDEEIRAKFPKDGEHGFMRYADITGAGTTLGESGAEWMGYDPSSAGRHWSAPKTGSYADFIDEKIIPGYKSIEGVHARLDALYENGLIEFSKSGRPNLVRYVVPSQAGVMTPNLWDDINPARGKESTGYPTQKPLALLERIIKASSNEGDIVFDPFCGCATTLVAADRLQRNYIGCDLSDMAVKLIKERLKDDSGLFSTVKGMTSLPRRTDGEKLPHYRTHAHYLYGKQEGVCNGCHTHFPYKVMDVDHIVPQSQNGGDELENLQLLCTHCNRSKGGKSMPEWNAWKKANGMEV